MGLKIKLIALAILPVIGLVVLVGHGQAATGEIYVSPSSASIEVGNSFTVSIRINPGTTVNAAQATLNYNSAYLKYVSYSVGAFSLCGQQPTPTDVTFSCAMAGSGTSSDSLIGSVTFTALAGSGNTALSISGANAVSAGPTYTNPSVGGGSVSFYSPTVAAPKHATSSTRAYTYTPSTSSATPSTTAAPAKVAAPPPKVTIKDKVAAVGYTLAKIDVSTNIATTDYVQYGTAANNLNQKTSTSASATSSSITLPSNTINPATTYYYQVVATDSGGNATKGSVGHLTTKGYSVSVTVLDSNNQPITGKIVTLHSKVMTATTNSKGVAAFYDVAPGLHHIEYASSKSKTYVSAVYVTNNFTDSGNNQSAAPQNAAVVLSGYTQPKNSNSFLYVSLMIVVAAAAGVATALLMNEPFRIKLKQQLATIRQKIPLKSSDSPAETLIEPSKEEQKSTEPETKVDLPENEEGDKTEDSDKKTTGSSAKESKATSEAPEASKLDK